MKKAIFVSALALSLAPTFGARAFDGNDRVFVTDRYAYGYASVPLVPSAPVYGYAAATAPVVTYGYIAAVAAPAATYGYVAAPVATYGYAAAPSGRRSRD